MLAFALLVPVNARFDLPDDEDHDIVQVRDPQR
jgi:hypothetical protein